MLGYGIRVTFPGSRLPITGDYGLDYKVGYPCLSAVTFRIRILTCGFITFSQVDQLIWYSRMGYATREQGRLPAVTFRTRILTCGNTTFSQVDQLIWYYDTRLRYSGDVSREPITDYGRLRTGLQGRIPLFTCSYVQDTYFDLQKCNVSAGRPINLVFESGIRNARTRPFTCSYVQNTYSDLLEYNVSAGRLINLAL